MHRLRFRRGSTHAALPPLSSHQHPLAAIEHLAEAHANLQTAALQRLPGSTFVIGGQRKKQMQPLIKAEWPEPCFLQAKNLE